MDWDALPEAVAAFAVQLTRVDATARSGNALLQIQGALDSGWRKKRVMLAEMPIPVPPPRSKGLHPASCELHSAEMTFQFALGADIATALMPAQSQLQVRVVGNADYDHCVVELEDHWRVDTHDFAGTPREPHPLIHFQRGGHSQDAWVAGPYYVPGRALPAKADGYWQGLLQSPGPRIPFLPLCPILAIDFVIGQHDGDIWDRLRGTPEYRAIIADAQARLWTPFFNGLGAAELRRRWIGPWML